jgi:hypothetical protein
VSITFSKSHEDKSPKIETYAARIKVGTVAPNHAALLHRTDPAVTRREAKPDPRREIRDGESAVQLEFSKNLPV